MVEVSADSQSPLYACRPVKNWLTIVKLKMIAAKPMICSQAEREPRLQARSQDLPLRYRSVTLDGGLRWRHRLRARRRHEHDLLHALSRMSILIVPNQGPSYA